MLEYNINAGDYKV